MPWCYMQNRKHSKSGNIGVSENYFQVFSPRCEILSDPLYPALMAFTNLQHGLLRLPFKAGKNFKRSQESEKLPLESDLFPLPGSKDKSCVNIKSWPHNIWKDFKSQKSPRFSTHFLRPSPDSIERANLVWLPSRLGCWEPGVRLMIRARSGMSTSRYKEQNFVFVNSCNEHSFEWRQRFAKFVQNRPGF